MGTGKPKTPASPRSRAPAATRARAGNGELEALRGELDGARVELERAAERLHARECAITELRGRLERLERSLEAANGERDEADRRAQAHTERIAVLERDLTRRDQAQEERDRNLDELREQVRGQAEELAAARAAAGTAGDRAAKLREQLGVLRDEQARQLQLEEQELAAVRAELEAARGDIAELEAARARIAELERTLTAEREARSQLLTCPRCTGPMIELDHMGVTIDRCERCDGIYFDAGELEEIIRKEYAEPARPAPPPRHVDEVDDDDDTLVDAAPVRRGFFATLFGRRPGGTGPTDGGNGAR